MQRFIIRLAAAAIIGAAAIMWALADDAPSYERAKNMLASGIVTRADVASALIEKTGSSPKSLILKFSFTTEKGETITGSRFAPVEMLQILSDPEKTSELLPDASVEIVYLPDSPQEFDFKANLEQKIAPSSRLPILVAIGTIPGAVVFFALGFIPALRLRKRKSPDPAIAAVSPPAA